MGTVCVSPAWDEADQWAGGKVCMNNAVWDHVLFGYWLQLHPSIHHWGVPSSRWYVVGNDQVGYPWYLVMREAAAFPPRNRDVSVWLITHRTLPTYSLFGKLGCLSVAISVSLCLSLCLWLCVSVSLYICAPLLYFDSCLINNRWIFFGCRCEGVVLHGVGGGWGWGVTVCMADEGCVHAPRARGSSLCMLKGRAGHRSEKAVIYGRFSYKRLVTELLFLVSSETPPPLHPHPSPTLTWSKASCVNSEPAGIHSSTHVSVSHSVAWCPVGSWQRAWEAVELLLGMRGRRVVTVWMVQAVYEWGRVLLRILTLTRGGCVNWDSSSSSKPEDEVPERVRGKTI